MATTSLSLGDHWQDFIRAKVESGRYASATEVVREALRMMEERDDRLAALRAMVEEGRAQIARGEGIRDFDFEAFMAEADTRLKTGS